MVPVRVARWNMTALDLAADEVGRAAAVPVAEREYLSYEEGMRLWEAAERLTADPTVGHRAGAQQHINELGALGAMFAHASSVRTAFEAIARTYEALVPGSRIELCPQPAWTELRYSRPPSATRSRHGVESLAAALVTMARHCTRQSFPLVRVAFDNPPPVEVEPYTRFYGVEPEWDADHVSLELREETLALRLTSADIALHRLLLDRIEELMPPARSVSPRMVRIHRAILTAVHLGDPSLAGVARELGVGRRTLQRQLEAEGVTFRALVQDVKRIRAEQLLARDGQTVEQVADMLGYSSRSAFDRAFLTWTGETPRAFQRRSGIR